MKSARNGRKGNVATTLGMLGVVALAALVIIASTLIFSYNARRAADETTTALGRFYLEEIADRNVYEITSTLTHNVEQLQRAVEEMRHAEIQTTTSLRTYLSMIQQLNGLDM